MRADRDKSISRSPSTSFIPGDPAVPVSPVVRFGRIGVALAATLVVANCASQQKVASRGGIDPKYGVAASPKVVADGEPVPKGGGQYMVGKPYVVGGRLYTPREMKNYSAVGLASWYGPSFHGRLTANGEVFDRDSVSAAHPTMPLPSYVRVTNMRNGYSIIARVNDRGPYHGGRLIDVSQRVAEALSFRHMGTTQVKVDYVGRASLSGSDDSRLLATLRTDGMPAGLRGGDVQVASAEAAEPAPAAAAPAPAPQVRSVVARAPEPEQEEAQAPVAAAPAAILSAKPAPGVPLPPDRPFDLGHVAKSAPAPAAAPAVPAKVPLPLPRTASRGGTTLAGLFYAPDEQIVTSFRRDSDPLAGLIEQNFVPLRREAKL